MYKSIVDYDATQPSMANFKTPDRFLLTGNSCLNEQSYQSTTTKLGSAFRFVLLLRYVARSVIRIS
jgi:hypothetical protein